MKKITAMLLSAAILLLAACGGTPAETAPATAETTATTTTAAEKTTAVTATEQPAEITTAEATTERPAETTTTEATTAEEPTQTSSATESVTEAETTSEDAAPDEETPLDYGKLDEAAYNAAVERSLMSEGNNARLKTQLKRAENGEKVTVAYIGGSITEGIGAGPDYCWARLSYEWLKRRYNNVEYVNAGMSGTPSDLGVVRAERDVTDYDPDIVFIEFAVNNSNSDFAKDSYESLIRRFLSLSEDTAVVLFFTIIRNGYTCEDYYMKTLGEHYDLPMVSLKSALTPEIEGGALVWEDYSDDDSHPNLWGHKFVASMIENLFTKTAESAETDTEKAMPEPLYGDSYINMHLLDSSSVTPVSLGSFYEGTRLSTFPNAWEHKNGAEPLVFELDCKSLVLVCVLNNSARYGTAEIYVDGELKKTINSNREDGWNNPDASLIFNEDEVKTHRIEIKPAEGFTENSFFSVAALGYGD